MFIDIYTNQTMESKIENEADELNHSMILAFGSDSLFEQFNLSRYSSTYYIVDGIEEYGSFISMSVQEIKNIEMNVEYAMQHNLNIILLCEKMSNSVFSWFKTIERCLRERGKIKTDSNEFPEYIDVLIEDSCEVENEKIYNNFMSALELCRK